LHCCATAGDRHGGDPCHDKDLEGGQTDSVASTSTSGSIPWPHKNCIGAA
jgi:hypothetical protein